MHKIADILFCVIRELLLRIFILLMIFMLFACAGIFMVMVSYNSIMEFISAGFSNIEFGTLISLIIILIFSGISLSIAVEVLARLLNQIRDLVQESRECRKKNISN
jgi:membrane-anchored glycerophosphoryl diester phosphodiesterase (GDPDase)